MYNLLNFFLRLSIYSLFETDYNRRQIALELYKNIIGMQMNKLKAEGKNLEDYTFESDVLNKKENFKLKREINKFVTEQKLEMSIPRVIEL